jgi:hypothetical protein
VHVLPCWGVIAWIRCPVCGGIHRALADSAGEPFTGERPARCGSYVYVHTGLHYGRDKRAEVGEGALRGMAFVWPPREAGADPLDARLVGMKLTHPADGMVVPEAYAGLSGWFDWGALSLWERFLARVWPLYL